MNPYLVLSTVLFYCAVIALISYITSRKAGSGEFYLGGKKSPWFVVAFGMIGTALSGVTFISVPGWVCGPAKMTYLEVVLGNFLGYIVVAMVLLPLYYKMNLTSIYTFMNVRFGKSSYKTSAVLFLVSRVVGAAFRVFIVALVLQITLFEPLHVPFEINVCLIMLMIWLYTFKGGIKSIIWSDLFQTSMFIAAVIFTIIIIKNKLGLSFGGMVEQIFQNPQSQIFDFSDFINNKYNFFKQFIGGIFLTITMVGMDQDMMQKNLSLKNIGEAKKNFFTFSISFVLVNLLFLILGVLLFMFLSAQNIQMPSRTDEIYPLIATNYLGTATIIFFILGIVAATFSSANSAIIALTTSFMVDIYGQKDKTEAKLKKTRYIVHTSFAVLLVFVILVFNAFNDRSVVEAIFKFAGYTYGPLLGLFTLGVLFKKIDLNDRFVPIICIITPILTVLFDKFSEILLNGYKFGFEILILNGLLTFIGLLLIRKK